jgi:Mn-containing catalase
LSYAKWRIFKGFQLCCSYEVAPEQKARKTYDNILRLAKDQEVADPIRFLREREIVHFQRFGEALRLLQEELDSKNYYAFNPNFDCMQNATR